MSDEWLETFVAFLVDYANRIPDPASFGLLLTVLEEHGLFIAGINAPEDPA